MEKKKLTPEQIELLKKPLPAEAVKPHPTKTFLSSIKAIYVVERLNDVFGIGCWKLASQVIDASTPMIVIKAVLSIPEYDIELESFGGNDNGGENSKNHDLGDAYKGATTDALTKICSYLGIGMDVYKGLHGNGGDQKKPDQPELPWLNEGSKEYDGALKKLRAGTTTIPKIKTVMRLSKKVEEKLLQEMKTTPATN